MYAQKDLVMTHRMQFYIDGAWVDPTTKNTRPVINPATEEAMYEIALASKSDVDTAVAGQRRSAATSSRATGANGAATVSRSTWR
jgi:aldehyde dehydrogenase (NAD+)